MHTAKGTFRQTEYYGWGNYQASQSVVDLTDFSSISVFRKIPYGGYETNALGQTGYAPTAGQQVEMVGLLFGEGRAKKYVEFLSAKGFSADTPATNKGQKEGMQTSLFNNFVAKKCLWVAKRR